jgi:hypothetical protein
VEEAMNNPIHILRDLCAPLLWGSYSGLWGPHPELWGYQSEKGRVAKKENPQEIVAAIRGLCFALGDREGEHCLGDFPSFVLAQVPSYGNETWYDVLSHMITGKSLFEASAEIRQLIKDWINLNPTLPADITPADDNRIDWDTYRQMEKVLREPHAFVPHASTLREMLAFLMAIRICRGSPHGSIPGIFELNKYLNEHFHQRGQPVNDLLLGELEHLPFRDACMLIADLVKSWRKSKEG